MVDVFFHDRHISVYGKTLPTKGFYHYKSGCRVNKPFWGPKKYPVKWKCTSTIWNMVRLIFAKTAYPINAFPKVQAVWGSRCTAIFYVVRSVFLFNPIWNLCFTSVQLSVQIFTEEAFTSSHSTWTTMPRSFSGSYYDLSFINTLMTQGLCYNGE